MVEGFTTAHVEKIHLAAKDPALSSKLEAMPIPMNVDDVERLYEADFECRCCWGSWGGTHRIILTCI
jgi:hypothetical protein